VSNGLREIPMMHGIVEFWPGKSCGLPVRARFLIDAQTLLVDTGLTHYPLEFLQSSVFLEVKWSGLEATTHLCSVLTSGMSGALPTLLYATVSCLFTRAVSFISEFNGFKRHENISWAINLTILIYKTIIIPIWSYGLEIWGCASNSNISIIQRSQSKILRMILDAPWYVFNETLHTDLGISRVQDVIQQKSNKHHNKIDIHENPLLKVLLIREDNRRLKRNWPIDLT
jgi:hypothetical protein